MNIAGLIAGLLCGTLLAVCAPKPSPAPPLTAVAQPDGPVLLSWPKWNAQLALERRLAGDELFRRIALLPPRTLSFVDSTLPPNATCRYRLRPVDARYLELFGPEVQVSTVLASPPPPELARTGARAIRITADPAHTHFPIVVEHKRDGVYQPVGTLTASSVSCVDTLLTANQYHYYRLRVFSGGVAGPASPADSLFLDLPPPTGVQVRALSDHAVMLTWQTGTEYATAHEIERMSAGQLARTMTRPGSVAYVDSTLTFGQSAYYRLRARGAADSSAWSPSIQVHLQPQPPLDLAVDPVHDESVWLTWSHPDSLAQGFIVERAVDTAPFTAIARLNGRTMRFIDREVERGAIYHYRVLSSYSGGATAASAAVQDSIPFPVSGMVRIADAVGVFFVDAAEVTVRDYLEFCQQSERERPEDPGFSECPDYWAAATRWPAVNVSWFDAIAYCNWRSTVLGLTPAYDSTGTPVSGADGFRLFTRDHFLRALNASDAAEARPILAGPGDGGSPRPCDATLAAGIQHLRGNVWEWTQESVDDARLIIGGAFSTPRVDDDAPPEFCYRPDFRSPTIGFRCLLPR